MSERAVFDRRARMEKRIERQITGPDYRATRRHIEHSQRIALRIDDGMVFVGSDSHYWPDIVSTAHQGFLYMARKFKPKIVIKNGDVLDGATISRHPPIGWEDRPKLIEELTTVKERLNEIRDAAKGARFIWSLGNHDCLDIQTECLTKRGWLRYCDIKKDDMVLSKDGDAARWSTIDEVVSFPFVGNLARVEKTRMSMAVTPNHRVLLKRLNWRTSRYDKEEYRQADDLPCSFDLPTAAQINNPGVDLTDDQISLAGWILTDGHFGQYDISIYQSKPAGIEQIGALLERLGFDYSFYERQREARVICGRAPVRTAPLPSTQFYIKAADAKKIKGWLPPVKRLPPWALDLSARQFAVFLDAVVAGDGCWDGYNPPGKTCCVIYGTHEMLGDIQAAAVLHGWRARLATDNRGDFRLWLTKEPKIRVERPEIFSEKYAGTVWCLRVPTGNFMVRRNGCAYFTGNSRYETRLATIAPEFAKIHGFHLKDHFPEWEPCWSVWINDDVVVKHRFKGGIHAPWNNTIYAGRTMVTGHLHSQKVMPFTDYNGTRWGVDAGTMADPDGPQFEYLEDNPRNWRQGFCILTFKNGVLLQPELVRVHAPNVLDFRGELINI